MATIEQIEVFLDSPCAVSEWEDSTWREWLTDCLVTLLEEGEGFSGKRPNCSSGWEREVEPAFVNLGASYETVIAYMTAPKSTLTPPAAEEHALPAGWTWAQHFDMWVADKGIHQVCVNRNGVSAVNRATLRGVDAPIAVVRAVISRNAKVTT